MDEILVAGKTGTAQAAEIKDLVRDADGKVMRDQKGKAISVPAGVSGDAAHFEVAASDCAQLRVEFG